MPSSLEQSGPGNKLARLRMTLDDFSEILRMSLEPPFLSLFYGGFFTSRRKLPDKGTTEVASLEI